MEEEKLLKSSVRQRVTSCLFSKNHSHPYVRGLVMGSLFPIYMAQVTVFMQLKQSIQFGELPWFSADVIIVGLAAVEALIAPLIAWVGYRRRRTMMRVCLLLPALFMLLMLAIPDAATTPGSEFCSTNTVYSPSGITTNSAIRLAVMALICLSFSFALVGVWCHGIGFMAEHSVDGLSIHIGILISARILGMMMVPKFLHPGMAMWLKVLGTTLPLLITVLLQLQKLPEEAPASEGPAVAEMADRGFMVSLSRVLSNTVAFPQIIAMSLVAAALWGFGWHETDIVKAQYFAQYSSTFMSSYADILRYHFVILMILFMATKFSAPLMPVFNKVSAIQVGVVVSFMVTPIYLAIVFFYCDKGTVAGLERNNYTQPICSSGCGCSQPYNEFSPVCAVDQMITYLSPCHAGCTSSQDFGGLSALVNCACTSGGRATLGACAAVACNSAFELHKLVYLAIIILTVVILQAQFVVVLRAVDPRDRGMALGLTCSLVALIAFVCIHTALLGVRSWTCAWFENGQCQLQNWLFSYLIGAISAALVLISAIISLVTWLKIRRQIPKHEEASSDIEL